MNFNGYSLQTHVNLAANPNWQMIAQQSFQKHDRDGSGSIDMNEFPSLISELFTQLHVPPPPQHDMWYLMNHHDKNKDSKIDWNEYMAMIMSMDTHGSGIFLFFI